MNFSHNKNEPTMEDDCDADPHGKNFHSIAHKIRKGNSHTIIYIFSSQKFPKHFLLSYENERDDSTGNEDLLL